MKLLLAYVLGFSLAWLALLSLLAGLDAWPRDGAFLPLLAGLALLLAAARLLLALVRQYIPPADRPGL
jgi:CHASE2 domain-containing sensor protein